MRIDSALRSPLAIAIYLSIALTETVVLAFPMSAPVQPATEVACVTPTALALGTVRKDQEQPVPDAAPAPAPERGGLKPKPAPADRAILASIAPEPPPGTLGAYKANRAIPDAPTADERGLVTLETGKGLKYVVRAEVASRFQKLVAWLEDRDYPIKEIGCYARRRIKGVGSWSNHSRGTACDINPDQNPVSYGRVVTDLPAGIEKASTAAGLRWGGAWEGGKKDAMHFDVPTSARYAVIGGGESRSHARKVGRPHHRRQAAPSVEEPAPRPDHHARL